MTDESRPDEEYEPADVDPDDPIETMSREPRRPTEADPADWLDQERDAPQEDERDDGGESAE